MSVTQTYKARFEIPDDIDWIAESGATPWRDIGLELIDFEWDGLYDTPDRSPTITMTLRASSRAAMSSGLEALVKHIESQGETHVLVQSLKPIENYDGKRDGYFHVDEPEMSQLERAVLKRSLMR